MKQQTIKSMCLSIDAGSFLVDQSFKNKTTRLRISVFCLETSIYECMYLDAASRSCISAMPFRRPARTLHSRLWNQARRVTAKLPSCWRTLVPLSGLRAFQKALDGWRLLILETGLHVGMLTILLCSMLTTGTIPRRSEAALEARKAKRKDKMKEQRSAAKKNSPKATEMMLELEHINLWGWHQDVTSVHQASVGVVCFGG